MSIGRDLMDRENSEPTRRLLPNPVVLALRADRGWGRARLAKEMDAFCRRQNWASPDRANLEKQIYRLETGRINHPDDFYTQLYCEFFDMSPHDLFGDIATDPLASQNQRFQLRSHKFIPAYVGADHVEEIRISLGMTPCEDQWLDCFVAEISDGGVAWTLYAWPWGVVVYHLVEDLEMAAVAELAVWRRASYATNIAWADDHLRRLTGADDLNVGYALSTYWLDTPIWSGAELETALRLMCIPRVLLERQAGESPISHALLVERALLREGFTHPEIVEFGMRGMAAGYASWSGVVYHPTAPSRCLAETELVTCELAVQALWAYCDYIREQVERGVDPALPAEFGWRFLRAVRARVTAERPRESSQHRSMREAITTTSGLTRHLSEALDTLRGCEMMVP